MRWMCVLVLVAASGSVLARSQVTSSANMGCTVTSGGMACNGIGSPERNEEEKQSPRLFVTDFILQPGAALDEPGSISDCLILGINGGDLVNEKTPFLHVSLEKNSVTLLPKGHPYRLRNKGTENVDLRLIEIRR